MNHKSRRSRSQSRATRNNPRDGPCESNDKLKKNRELTCTSTTEQISPNVELDALKEPHGANAVLM